MGRVAYFNGKIVPENEAKVSIWDAGFQVGQTVFETERTFNHKIFELSIHLDRLWRSAKYAAIDIGLSKQELKDATEQVLQQNLHLIGPDEEYWVYQHITGGLFNFFHSAELEESKATVIINCFPVAFDYYSKFYSQGAHLVIPSIRLSPPVCQDPKMKCRSRINYHLADLQAKQSDPDAYCLMLDTQGNVAENRGANFFMVRDGALWTPTTRNVLEGVCRSKVIELAKQIGRPVYERDLQLYDVYNADEAFLTSTSFCILPVSKIDHASIGNRVPGPVTQDLLDSWSREVGVDIVGQAVGLARNK